MKIAVNAVGLAPGGGLTYLINQARQLQRLAPDWSITYFVAPRCRPALLEVVNRSAVVVPFDTQPTYARRVWWEQVRLPRLLLAECFTALYSIGGFAVFRSTVPQLLLCANANHHAGSNELGFSALWLRYRAERFLARAGAGRVDRLVFVSDSFARSMVDVGFPEPTAVIPSGVSIDLPEPAVELPIRLQCASCRSDGFALAIHNWYRHKDLPWLMKTWAARAESCASHLVIVGAPADRSTAREIRSLMNEPDIREHVHVIGNASRVEVATLLGHARLYISASRIESFGLTPFEAMSVSVPCVLSDIGPHREFAGEAATYFDPGQADQLENAVRRAHSERSLSVGRGHAQVQGYSWEANVKKLIDELKIMVDERVGRHRQGGLGTSSAGV